MPARKKLTARGTRPHSTRRLRAAKPIANPECEVVTVHFEVDNEVVSIIDNEFNRIAIFPSERIGGLIGFENPFSPERLAERLRSAIVTVMSDLEPEDNGIC